MKHNYLVLFPAVILLPLIGLQAQKKLTVKDYGQWQTLGSTVFSENGKMLAYTINLVEGDGWLILKDIETDKEKKIPNAVFPVFSNDNRWLVYTIQEHGSEGRGRPGPGPGNRDTICLMNLETSFLDTIEGVESFNFSPDGKYLVLKITPRDKNGSSDLVIRNLAANVDDVIGNVAQFCFNDSGAYLALIVDTEGKIGNGVHIIDLKSYSKKVLDNYKTHYSNLVWNKDGTGLVFLRAEKNAGYEGDNHKIIVYGDLDKPHFKRYVFDPVEISNFPEGYRITEERELQWSDDNRTIFFGVKEWKKNDDELDNKEPGEKGLFPAGVEVWHWRDDPIFPGRKLLAERLKRHSYLAAWNRMGNTFVQLVKSTDVKKVILDGDLHGINEGKITGDQKYVVIYDQRPYEPIFEDNWRDIYLVDVKTGQKQELMKKFPGQVTASPCGKYLLYFKDKDWWVYNIGTGRHSCLTEDIPAHFEDPTSDYGFSSYPPYGIGVWIKTDDSVLLYDRYDVYKVSLNNGRWKRLTFGEEERIRFRYVDVYEKSVSDPFMRRFMRRGYSDLSVELDPPLYFSAYGDFTKESGYYRLVSGGKLEKVIYEPFGISELRKIPGRDLFAFIKQKADVSPNLFLTDHDFKSPRQLTDTNPQQKGFFWAKSELVDYKNGAGDELQGSLLYPADYQPGKKYPMIVRLYELQSQNLHNYRMPSEYNAYNERRWSSEGFFFFEPDIVNKLDNPGLSAVDCVVHAVEAVVKTGKIDRDRIGLMGHSWGAYETCFIITQTDIFKAALAGAAPTNMISLSGVIADNYGQPQMYFFETAQPRFSEPYWKILDNYLNNSAVYNAFNISTPLLLAYGTKDGILNWDQGIELYTAMRRLQKPFVFLVYEGEGHGLRKRENMLDYATRAHEWMRHYLLDEEPAKWITDGASVSH